MKRVKKYLLIFLISIPGGVQLDLPPISRTDFEITGVDTFGYTDPGYKLRDYVKYYVNVDSTYTCLI